MIYITTLKISWEKQGKLTVATWKIGISGEIPESLSDSDRELLKKQMIQAIERKISHTAFVDLCTDSKLTYKGLKIVTNIECQEGTIVMNVLDLDKLMSKETV